MKKILTFLVSLALVLPCLLISCSKDEAEEPEGTEDQSGTEEPDEPDEPEGTGGQGGTDDGYTNNLCIPLSYNPNNVTKTSGTDGDVYYTYASLRGSKPGYIMGVLSVFSHTSYDGWLDFITTGTYNGTTYDISFEDEDDFWLNYKGQSKEDAGLAGTLYYINPDDDSPILIENSQTSGYCGYGGGYLTSGFNWFMDSPGGSGSEDYLWVGAQYYLTDDTNCNFKVGGDGGTPIVFTDIPNYDADGKKFLFTLTVKSKDIYEHPDIVFYSYVHVTEETEAFDPLYIPLDPKPNDLVNVEVRDGEFYYTYAAVNNSFPTYNSGGQSVMTQSTHEEWTAFVTTGSYGGKTYEGFDFADEDAFWDAYKGKNADNKGIDYAVYYINPVSDRAVLLVSHEAGYGNYNSNGWHAGGIQWNIIPTDGKDPYFWTGVHNYLLDSRSGFSVEFDKIPNYDEDGKKFYFTITINTENEYENPSIVFYSYMHVTEKPVSKDALNIPLKIDTSETVSGTAGDVYIKWEDIANNSSTSLGVIPTYSSMTLDEWSDFIQNGKYNGETYSDISFAAYNDKSAEDAFYEAYKGGADASGQRCTIGVWYYDQNGNKVEHRVRTEEAHRGSTWNINGFQFYLGNEGVVFSNSEITTDKHFAAGIHHLLMDEFNAADIPAYDDYGQKYYVLFSFPSKDDSVYPDINFYADVHISTPLKTIDPIYIPVPYRPGSNTGKDGWTFSPSGTDGDFYYSYEDILNSDTSLSKMAEMSSITYDEWVTFLTTGMLNGTDYGLGYSSEDDFWTHYKGADSDNRGIDDEIFYVNPNDDSLVCLRNSQNAYAGGYGSSHSSWNTGGIQWMLRAVGGDSSNLSDHLVDWGALLLHHWRKYEHLL